MLCGCGGKMRKGALEIRTHVAERVLGGIHGLSTRPWFVPHGEDDASPVDLTRAVYCCQTCGCIVIDGASTDDGFACFECGTQIPTRAKACPACNWTW